MIWNGGIYFLFFASVTIFTAWRLGKAYRKEEFITRRSTLLVVGIAVIGAFYYLSVMAFALFVFPYIPAAKGGGDFRFGGNVKIVVRTNKDAIAARFMDPQGDGRTSRELKLIHDTEGAVFVADPSDGEGPAAWSRFGGTNPTVISINKRVINSIIFLNE